MHFKGSGGELEGRGGAFDPKKSTFPLPLFSLWFHRISIAAVAMKDRFVSVYSYMFI